MRNRDRERRPATGKGEGFYLIYTACFLLFLPLAALDRLTARRGQGAHRGIFAEAARRAGTVTPFAFMG